MEIKQPEKKVKWKDEDWKIKSQRTNRSSAVSIVYNLL